MKPGDVNNIEQQNIVRYMATEDLAEGLQKKLKSVGKRICGKAAGFLEEMKRSNLRTSKLMR